MVNVIYRKHGLKVNAVWFCENLQAAIDASTADIVFFHGIDDPGLDNSFVIPQKTMITDIREPVEELFSRISSSCKNRIHKAERENLKFEVFYTADLKADPALLDSFVRDFSEFTKQKGIRNAYNKNAVMHYIKSGDLILTKVTKGSVCYAQHTFISDGRHTRGLYSVSNFRAGGMDKKISANANRFLHWKEIEYLHQKGFETYDWGGITDDKQPNGVDAFKLEFRGRTCDYSNVFVARTPKGNAAVFLLKKLAYRLFGSQIQKKHRNYFS